MNCKGGELQAQMETLHILLVPLQSEGHVNGLLRLARALAAEKGVFVTFGYPASFHCFALKRNKLPCLLTTSCCSSNFEQSNSMLRIEVLDDGLPLDEDCPVTEQMHRESHVIFQNAVKILVGNLLQKTKPPYSAPDFPPLRCIISDTLASWTQNLAKAAGLPRVDFWPSTAAIYSMCLHLSLLVRNGTLPLPKGCWLDSEKWTVDAPLIEGVPGLLPFPATDLPAEILGEESNPVLQYYLTIFEHARGAHAILIHSVYELERQVFDALQASGLPNIYAIGPLPDLATPTKPSSTLVCAESGGAGSARHECIQWLDNQPTSSVLYIAFGSWVKLSSAETHALALGLEASGHCFLWVIRGGSICAGSLSETLPEGFLERTVDKGVGMIISWSPQAEVLGHPAVGAFFSHCGWNSTLESMWEGVPMVACPRKSEQRSNARWIVEKWKTGVELERQVDGSFTKEAVERAVKEVMADHSAEVQQLGRGITNHYKERALHAKEVIRPAAQKGGHSHSNLVTFLQRLRL